MARKVENSKGFLVIAMTPKEAREICHFGDICDHCAEPYFKEEEVYYVPVLNLLFCRDCYEEWYNRKDTQLFPEDKKYELRYYIYYLKQFGRIEGEDREEIYTMVKNWKS